MKADLRPRDEPLELGPYEVPHPSPFLCELTAGRGDVSRVIEHVNNIEYVRWLDRGAELHADALGYTRKRMLEAGVMWFVARHEVDYLAEAWPGDELVLATWVRDMQRVKSWRESVVVRPADGTAICRAATLWVFIDLETRRPARIPREMAERFAPLEMGAKPRCTSA